MDSLVILIALVIGLFAGWAVTYRVMSMPNPTVELNPNDYTIPDPLPMFDNSKVQRGFSVDGNQINMSWEHKMCNQYRVVTVKHGNYTQAEFLDTWYKNELNYYLKNKAIFDAEGKTNE